MEIRIIAENIKSIQKIEFDLKIDKGIICITGNNGSGKSTLLTCIAKLVRPSVFATDFKGANFDESRITYISASGQTITWVKKPIWRTLSEGNEESMFKLKGFYESSLLAGLRFLHLEHKNIKLNNTNIEFAKKAPDFIIENLNYIISGSESHYFDELYYTKIKRKNKETEKMEELRIYFLKDKNITEFEFSTGEYILLSILKIVQTFANRKNQKDIRLLIIDEIEFALHPLAQERLIERLKEWAEKYNILIIFATHSLQIIENLDPKFIYYIENDKIYSPIYPAYITSKLYHHKGYDKIILVEDEKIEKIVHKLIKDSLDVNLKYKIIPIGGWEKVLEIHKDSLRSKYFGNADIVSILDGDVKSEANKKRFEDLKKNFLPIPSVEKYFVEVLLKNDDFIREIEIHLGINFHDISVEIPQSQILNTKKIKGIYNNFIDQVSKMNGKSKYEIEEFIIDYIMRKEDFNQLNKFLSDFLTKECYD